MEGFPMPWAQLARLEVVSEKENGRARGRHARGKGSLAQTLGTVPRYMENNKGRTIRKVMGGGGIFEPQEFFSLSNSLYEFFFRPWYEYF